MGDADELELVREWDKEKKYGMPIKHDEDKLKLQLQRGGEALYFSHCKSDETWVPLMEKAYAKAHGDYTAVRFRLLQIARLFQTSADTFSY